MFTGSGIAVPNETTSSNRAPTTARALLRNQRCAGMNVASTVSSGEPAENRVVQSPRNTAGVSVTGDVIEVRRCLSSSRDSDSQIPP